MKTLIVAGLLMIASSSLAQRHFNVNPDRKVILGFIIDSSGSMTDSDPLNIRKEALKEIIGFLQGDETVLLMDFDNSTRLLNRHNIYPFNRTLLMSQVDLIDSDGGTNIGLSLFSMRQELEKFYTPGDAAGILLFTDGKGSYNNEAEWYLQNGIPVYTISYKDNADGSLLNKIARITGGHYIKAHDEPFMITAFMNFYYDLLEKERIISHHHNLRPNERYKSHFFIESGCLALSANINFPLGSINFHLISPSGVIITKDRLTRQIYHQRYACLEFPNPEKGKWSIVFENYHSAENYFSFEIAGSCSKKVKLVNLTARTGPFIFELYQAQTYVDLVQLRPVILMKCPDNVIRDVSDAYDNGRIVIDPVYGKGDYSFDITVNATDISGETLQRQFITSAYAGDSARMYVSTIYAISGCYLKTPLNLSSGCRSGMRCSIYSPDRTIKKAEGYITFVSASHSQVEIQRFFNGISLVDSRDIIELNLIDWSLDHKP